MNENYAATYSRKLQSLRDANNEARAMELLVGGDFAAQGVLEWSLLLGLGLRPYDCIVDIGCGSGRLSFALRDTHLGRYVGTDILADALNFARQKVQRGDWSYLHTNDTVIPVPDKEADVVCFFSVFTHLRDEDCFKFLIETKRVARPGSLIVFSFLDFDVPCHWTVFENSMQNPKAHAVLNRFHAKSTIEAWAHALNLTIETFIDGSSPCVKLCEPIVFDDGRVRDGVVEFGQSVCVLRVPNNDAPDTAPPAGEGAILSKGTSPEITIADGQLYNTSVRGNVGAHEGALLAGFSIAGNPRRVLIRGIGASLSRFGVTNPCQQAQFEILTSAGVVMSRGISYASLGDMRQLYMGVFAEAGAFPLDLESSDAVLLATLAVGSYSVRFTSTVGGVGLLEIYVLPVARFSPDQIGKAYP